MVTRHRSTAFSARPLVGRGLEIILTRSGVSAGGSVPHCPEEGRGEHVLALDVHKSQRLAGVDHNRVVPDGPRAAQLASVDALDGHCQLIGLRERLKGGLRAIIRW
jgi:hypothetical protein